MGVHAGLLAVCAPLDRGCRLARAYSREIFARESAHRVAAAIPAPTPRATGLRTAQPGGPAHNRVALDLVVCGSLARNVTRHPVAATGPATRLLGIAKTAQPRRQPPGHGGGVSAGDGRADGLRRRPIRGESCLLEQYQRCRRDAHSARRHRCVRRSMTWSSTSRMRSASVVSHGSRASSPARSRPNRRTELSELPKLRLQCRASIERDSNRRARRAESTILHTRGRAAYPRDPCAMRNRLRTRLAAHECDHACRRRDSHLRRHGTHGEPEGACTRECTAPPVPRIGPTLTGGLGGSS